MSCVCVCFRWLLFRKLSPVECGKAGKAGIAARSQALERLKLHSPKLAFEREALWTELRNAYAAHIPLHLKHKGGAMAMGAHFVKEVRDVLKKLGEHYAGRSEWKHLPGDPNAFKEFYKAMKASLPKGTLDTTF